MIYYFFNLMIIGKNHSVRMNYCTKNKILIEFISFPAII